MNHALQSSYLILAMIHLKPQISQKDPAYASVLSEMRQKLNSRVKSINDLSMFPESMLFTEAFDDPVSFGRQNSARIASLVDIADLSLQSFDDAAADIAIALESEDPWMRYWGLIVLSSFREEAHTFIETARRIATEDGENLVRLRAAEFLGLVQAENPAPYLIEALRTANNEMEAVLILNTIVLLQDFHGHQIEVSSDIFPSQWQSNGQSNLTLRLIILIIKIY